jgi:hypothetical protein
VFHLAFSVFLSEDGLALGDASAAPRMIAFQEAR